MARRNDPMRMIRCHFCGESQAAPYCTKQKNPRTGRLVWACSACTRKRMQGHAATEKPLNAIQAITCHCGDVRNEHGGDEEFPGSTKCTVPGCECVAFEAGGSPRGSVSQDRW